MKVKIKLKNTKMEYSKINSIGELKESGWVSKSIKDELRDNLILSRKNNVNLFSQIHGYDETVIPDLERAILSKHDINFLGLRGQAKTKIARSLVSLLDEFIPVIKGSVSVSYTHLTLPTNREV